MAGLFFRARDPEALARWYDGRRTRELTMQRSPSLPGEHGFVVRFLPGMELRWSEACRAHRDHVREGRLTVARTKNKRVRRVPIPPGSFARTVRKLSGVESFRVHRCRHHYACAWLEKGGNLKALSYALGHGSSAVTERYARLTDQHVRNEAARIRAA